METSNGEVLRLRAFAKKKNNVYNAIQRVEQIKKEQEENL